MSEVKNSVISSSQPSGIWHNQNGVVLPDGQKGFYKWTYVMQDGTTITANHKENKPLSGPCSYEIRMTNEYGNLGKVGKPQEEQYTGVQQTKEQFKPETQQDKNRAFALSYAKDLFAGKEINALAVIAVADVFVKWLDNKPEEVQAPQAPINQGQGQLPPQPDAFQQHDNAPDWM